MNVLIIIIKSFIMIAIAVRRFELGKFGFIIIRLTFIIIVIVIVILGVSIHIESYR